MQLNAPHAAGPHLTGFLRSRGIKASQFDASIGFFLALHNRKMLPEWKHIEEAVAFLQGRCFSLTNKILSRKYFPEGPRFRMLDEMAGAGILDNFFGAGKNGRRDHARFIASLYLDGVHDHIKSRIDGRYSLSRFADALGLEARDFSHLKRMLDGRPRRLDLLLDQVARKALEKFKPGLVVLSVPFPGTLYGALRFARVAKRFGSRVAFGGGYVSTELRSLADARIFDYVDFICLDEGELPLLCLVEHVEGRRVVEKLARTMVRRKGRVEYFDHSGCPEVRLSDAGTPSYDGINPASYISMVETPNPMHRMWSDGFWNRLFLARGCYWARCRFCDTELRHIKCYDPCDVDTLIARMDAVSRGTGSRDFHFVDEAAHPVLLAALSKKLIKLKKKYRWWVNVRFERAFTPSLARLMRRAGCVAVTGGIEAATPALLKLAGKGVTLDAIATALRAFSGAGIMAHAYLMYALPGQTREDTVRSLDFVRGLFARGLIQSAYWHRFSLTAHSVFGNNPAAYGLRMRGPRGHGEHEGRRERGGPGKKVFALNDLAFDDFSGVDHDGFGAVLNRATYNFMHGAGFEKTAEEWFAGG